MAGRRGGRGGAGRGISFNIENLGFGRGESLPGPILQPPALFPPLEQKPVPLQAGEEGDYLLALKQEYQGSMKESVYFLKELQRKRDIERYSDKYQLGQGEEHWEPGGGEVEEHWEPGGGEGEEHWEPGGGEGQITKSSAVMAIRHGDDLVIFHLTGRSYLGLFRTVLLAFLMCMILGCHSTCVRYKETK
ncbi:hypothetical protein NP493_656g01014 [Ridgeia piscesae]|uniref:Uncharacterized protein n=1 Tax=Ridgeia piscesae TaxID=27915 RepID=A0AAD9KSK2_RIDPI|nr:hypothetical protein NP493_656g01014 [Ridgeia piscesae]